MPAAVAKGIILSLTIITALSIAVLENPQIQEWLEEQRKKIAELLRSIGEDLDPASRRAAEAFAYEDQTPTTNAGLRREADGSRDAAAAATGRSLSADGLSAMSTGAVRRIPVQGPLSAQEAEERRRKGREYLARRNEQMFELQQRRKAENGEAGSTTPPTPTSFDAMVDDEGKLRDVSAERELPSPPSVEPLPEKVEAQMAQVEEALRQPLLEEQARSSSIGWSLGSAWANPFDDEYAMDRSETPKPPVPPKVALGQDETSRESQLVDDETLPRHIDNATQPIMHDHSDLSYEEQVAIAISLSETESEASAAATATAHSDIPEEDDTELKAAIQASLRDMEERQTAKVSAQRDMQEQDNALVDLSPSNSVPTVAQPIPKNPWANVFGLDSREIQVPSEADSDDLYRVTPELTRARLATHEMRQSTPSLQSRLLQLEDVHEASLQSAHESSPPVSPDTRSHTLEADAQLIDVSEDPPQRERTPTPTRSRGTPLRLQSDSDSGSDVFASLEPSRAPSRARSEISNVEVIDVVDDSDVDMLSEEGDGIATPDSWTEVGSGDGESEDDEEHPDRAAVRYGS